MDTNLPNSCMHAHKDAPRKGPAKKPAGQTAVQKRPATVVRKRPAGPMLDSSPLGTMSSDQEQEQQQQQQQQQRKETTKKAEAREEGAREKRGRRDQA